MKSVFIEPLRRLKKTCNKAVLWILLTFIKVYRVVLSPYIGRNCRFNPSCSNYAEQALKEHNIFKALFLIIIRILKCHPLGPHGFDPVPRASKLQGVNNESK